MTSSVGGGAPREPRRRRLRVRRARLLGGGLPEARGRADAGRPAEDLGRRAQDAGPRAPAPAPRRGAPAAAPSKARHRSIDYILPAATPADEDEFFRLSVAGTMGGQRKASLAFIAQKNVLLTHVWGALEFSDAETERAWRK